MTKFVIMIISGERQEVNINHKSCKNLVFIISRNICFGYLLESPHWGDSSKYPKHMFCEQIRIEQGLSFITFCSLRIFYNSKFILIPRHMKYADEVYSFCRFSLSVRPSVHDSVH